MNHDDPSNAMFWVGGLMVLAPMLSAGVVIGFLVYKRRHAKKTADGR